jgi:TolB-like protein/DNA-binding winged helix-turn-helix (wHTH) protein
MGDPAKVLAFDDYELDLGRGELRRGGKLVEIQLTPLRVLLYLGEHRDRTVSRRELLDAIWPDVVVGDDALTTALKEARHAVGDAGAAQRVIRTRKGVGYRFVAEVVANGAAPIGSTRPFAAAAIALGLVSAATWWTIGRSASSGGVDARPPHTLVVLTFRNLSATHALDALGDGLAAQISDALQPPIHVIPTPGAHTIGREPAEVRELGRALGATHVLEGSVQEEGDRLRVMVQLHSMRSGLLTWSATFDQPRESLLAAQENVTNWVADEVPTHLPWERSDDPQRAALIDAVTQGRGQLWSGDDEGALSTLSGVLSRDPENATAHQLLAFIWVNLMNHGKRRPNEAIERIQWHAEQAMQAAPGSFDAHMAAALAALATNDWETAERESRAPATSTARPSWAAAWCFARSSPTRAAQRRERKSRAARSTTSRTSATRTSPWARIFSSSADTASPNSSSCALTRSSPPGCPGPTQAFRLHRSRAASTGGRTSTRWPPDWATKSPRRS